MSYNPLLVSAADWHAKEEMMETLYPHLSGEDLFDTLDGETDLKERIEWMLASLDKDERFAAALAEEIKDIQERKQRYDRKAKTKRDLIAEAMSVAGIKKLEFARWTISSTFTKGGVVITDEAAIPAEFVKTTTTPMKAEIKATLETGEDVPGASLGNGYPSVTIRKT